MPVTPSIPTNDAFLATCPMPRMTFRPAGEIAPVLESIWTLLQNSAFRQARMLAETALSGDLNFSSDIRAAMLAAAGAAELRMGHVAQAQRLAEDAIQLWPGQTFGWMILFEARVAAHDLAGALDIVSNLITTENRQGWDEKLSEEQVHIAAASLAWRLHKWDAVATHLLSAFPDGIETMPEWLLDDYFRVSLYRDVPVDAAAAAAMLIRKRSAESADTLLQTLVQQGWTEQALPLYRTAYSEAPLSALLRRRLVALCLREGAVEEARTLARPAALEIARASNRSATTRLRSR